MLQVGFDVGGTSIKAGVVNDELQVICQRNIPFPVGDYQKAVKLMADAVHDMAKELEMNPFDFDSIGIAAAGSIDASESIIVNAHNLGFHHVPIKEEMKKYFPYIKVFLANDADAAALAELYAGALRGCKTAVLITLGTGVGGGVILNGKIFRGGAGHGIELGHAIIDYGGDLCTCGNRGCIDTLCSASWIIRQASKALQEDPRGLILERSGGLAEKITAKLVIDCAREGDDTAIRIFEKYLDYLATAMNTCISLLDPEVIALGGGVSLTGDFLFEPLRRLVKEKSFFKADHQIVPAQLGNNAGFIGAAMLARDQKKTNPKTANA